MYLSYQPLAFFLRWLPLADTNNLFYSQQPNHCTPPIACNDSCKHTAPHLFTSVFYCGTLKTWLIDLPVVYFYPVPLMVMDPQSFPVSFCVLPCAGWHSGPAGTFQHLLPWANLLTGGKEGWNTLLRLRDLGLRLKLIKYIEGHVMYRKCVIDVGKTGASGASRLSHNLLNTGGGMQSKCQNLWLIVFTKQKLMKKSLN